MATIIHQIYPGPGMSAASVCEVCKKPLTQGDYLLCADCSRVLMIVLGLLRESKPITQDSLSSHPELTANDINRTTEILKWRNRKMGLEKAKPETTISPHS
jgi:hypothetical protein